MPRLSNLYLFTYNAVQAVCWAVSLFRILIDFSTTKSFNGAYASSGELICFLQKAAFLEVIHGALGIVPSGVLFPLMQWGGKTHYLLAIVRNIDEVQESPSIFITFVAWSISDFIRYSHYALNCIGSCPYWSTLVRYTAFIPLYPVGAAGEMWLMYHALPYVKDKDLYRDFFSILPFSYCTFIKVLLLCYPVLWLKLYLYLLKQRRSKLRKYHEKKWEWRFEYSLWLTDFAPDKCLSMISTVCISCIFYTFIESKQTCIVCIIHLIFSYMFYSCSCIPMSIVGNCVCPLHGYSVFDANWNNNMGYLPPCRHKSFVVRCFSFLFY